MTFSPAILRKVWYSPSINLGLRATSAIVLFLGLGVFESNHYRHDRSHDYASRPD